MSTNQELAPYQAAIKSAERRFTKIASGLLDYQKESVFAMQQIMKNDFSLRVATDNPSSVQLAMINVASTGLTLNPAYAYAYLVPRDGKILLDISYKGLIKIATDTGSILWAKADVVYERDTFEYHGPTTAPKHTADVFSKDRGNLIGSYCIAKTTDGDILTEIMPLEEIEKVRAASAAYAKKKAGPWVEWFTEMVKKSVIKRASKTWPYTQRTQRLFDAIEIANTTEGGYEFEDQAEMRLKNAIAGNGDTIKAVKNFIADGNLSAAAEAWYELPKESQEALWVAPSKGGPFTTQEREIMKSREFREANGQEAVA